ncbi:APOD protein, partial [Amia calva]|nr:APOD protein [Amia calva]
MLDGEMQSIEGTAIVKDSEQPAKLGVSFFFWQPYIPYWVLSTDYDSFALVYTCVDITFFHAEYAWIFSRSRTLPNSTVESLKEQFTSNGIDISKMSATVQTGCTNEI